MARDLPELPDNQALSLTGYDAQGEPVGAPPGSFTTGRGPRLFTGGGARGTAISTGSTVVVLAIIAGIFVLAPGARTVAHAFFYPHDMWQSFIGDPKKGYYSVGAAIWLNIRMFLVAEALILPFALVIALIRQSTHPALFPVRVIATIYVDFFRGVPLLLVVLALGLGVPGLYLPVISHQPDAVYGVTALVITYSAYVSEVYRAGLNSVHRSQVAAARSLGLTQRTALRYVILPQGGAQHHPAAAQRLHRAAEGHLAGGRARRDRGQPGREHLRLDGLQLFELHGCGDPVPDPDDPAGPVHRPAHRAGPAPSARWTHHMNGGAIRIEGLRKSFGPNVVLKGINLAVDSHEVVCLIGASGSGKSTLLRCVNLLEPIDSGKITLLGQDITAPNIDQNLVRRQIGIVFQSFNLFPHMTVLRNVTLAPTKVLKMPKEAAAGEALALLDRFGLADKRDDYPDRLSGGQQQRVAIVRALAMRPQIMLLDEVTSALDPELVAEVLDVIGELASGGMTMVIATHEMGFARDIANRVCFLEEGTIIEDAPPAELFTAPKDERTRRFLRRIVDAKRL